MPTLTSAVAMGNREAAREPKARNSTTAATATPTISAVCPPDGSLSSTALPPSSTSSPSVSAAFAVLTTASASPLVMSLPECSKVTVA